MICARKLKKDKLMTKIYLNAMRSIPSRYSQIKIKQSSGSVQVEFYLTPTSNRSLNSSHSTMRLNRLMKTSTEHLS